MIYKSSIGKWTILQHIDKNVYPEFRDWNAGRCPYCQKDFSNKYRGNYDRNCDIKNWLIHIWMKHRTEKAVAMLEKLLGKVWLSMGDRKHLTEREFEDRLRELRAEVV
jgi:hypothetical protein